MHHYFHVGTMGTRHWVYCGFVVRDDIYFFGIDNVSTDGNSAQAVPSIKCMTVSKQNRTYVAFLCPESHAVIITPSFHGYWHFTFLLWGNISYSCKLKEGSNSHVTDIVHKVIGSVCFERGN